jgi:hypothetical protein
MVKAFNRSACRDVSQQIEKELAPLAERLGLRIITKGGSYTGGSYCLKVECSVVNEDGSAQTREAEAFRQLAGAYGLSPEDLGASFTSGGKTYVVTGLKTRARKRPIQAECNGRTYVFGADTVKALLTAART